MMNMRGEQRLELPIGIFDSGVGGLTVVRQIRRALPDEDLVYLGDTARVPYGTKSPGTVVRFACEDTEFLLRRNVKAVVVACNTASAWALSALEKRFDVPIFGVIAPGVTAALGKTKTRRIGIIGTSATIRSGAYEKGILARESRCKVFTRACPLLVPLVEENWIGHPVTARVLREYLRPLLGKKIDTLVLGCTHYPLLKPVIRRLVGGRVALVDSAESCAADLAQRLQSIGLLRKSRARAGRTDLFVTDEIGPFQQLARRFLGAAVEPPQKVDLVD